MADVPVVSTKISAIKGVEVIVQIVMGYFITWVSVKCAAKFGLPLDLTAQNQIVLTATILISGILNGAYNWITHRFVFLDIGKKILKP
jgi:hypothetical protein